MRLMTVCSPPLIKPCMRFSRTRLSGSHSFVWPLASNRLRRSRCRHFPESLICNGCPRWIRTINKGSKGLCVTVTPSGNITTSPPLTYVTVTQVSPKSFVTCMVYFRDRTYKKFSRVRVPIQPLKEANITLPPREDEKRLSSSIPIAYSTGFGYPNGLRNALKSRRKRRSFMPT
jgi:hypothetical protein